MRVCFVFAGSRSIGLGHIARTVAISAAFADQDGLSYFFDGDSYGLQFFASQSAAHVLSYDQLKATGTNVVVVDCPAVNDSMARRISEFGCRIALSPVFTGDVVFTHAFLRCTANFSTPAITQVGRAWAVIDKLRLRAVRNGRRVFFSQGSEPLHIGILLSGAHHDLFQSVVDQVLAVSCSLEKEVAITAVRTGSPERYSVSKDGVVSRALDESKSVFFDTTRFFSEISFLVVGDGLTVDEACFVGIPAICLTSPERQFKVSELSHHGAILLCSTLRDLKRSVALMIENIGLRLRLAEKGPLIVDGLAADRIASEIKAIALTSQGPSGDG